jgi:hypothetical protein
VNTTVAQGSPASFSGTASGADTLRWQWYRNGVPLSDSGEVSGAHTPSLAISSATPADSGTYFFVVSNGCQPDTSGVARLTLTSATAVPGANSRGQRPRIASLGAQPAAGSMRISVALPQPGRACVQVDGADGRRVAALPERALPAGLSEFQWNGGSAVGSRAPSGIYYIRLIVDGVAVDTRRAVLVR